MGCPVARVPRGNYCTYKKTLQWVLVNSKGRTELKTTVIRLGGRYRDTPAVRDGYKQFDATRKELTDGLQAPGREEVAGVAPKISRTETGRRYLAEAGKQGSRT